jgi:hypothetical protein
MKSSPREVKFDTVITDLNVEKEDLGLDVACGQRVEAKTGDPGFYRRCQRVKPAGKLLRLMRLYNA